MYYLLVRESDPALKSNSATFCIYGNGYRPSWWGYTIEEAIKNYLSKSSRSCTGTLEECVMEGGNHIIYILPFEVLDTNYIIDHHPELFI